MSWQFGKQIGVFILVVISFVLILLLPREMEVRQVGPLQMEADYPFTLQAYWENIQGFLTHFQQEGGFGTSTRGEPIVDQVLRYVERSTKIILPAFVGSMALGVLFGGLQFYYRNKKRGKLQAFLSWIFSSVPDFFLFIAVQYLLIKLMNVGLPSFSLFGHEEWYSFIIPAISLMILPLIHMMRVTSASMENEMSQEYIRTVYSKGSGTRKAMFHMIWNCWGTIINQAQIVMLYILSGLPIIEKLSSYNGAGYQLLQSIHYGEVVRGFALMFPFLMLMFLVMLIAQVLKLWLLPREEGA